MEQNKTAVPAKQNATVQATADKIAIQSYAALPAQARQIRCEVFMQEQGFVDEFDAQDQTATHMVLFAGGQPAAACRYFAAPQPGVYIVGRLAVRRPWRGRALGAALLAAAEEEIRAKGGRAVRLHAQQRAAAFYQKSGYQVCSGVEYEEYCPHVWMQKAL